MPLSIFRVPNLSAANVVTALLGAAWIAMWFFLNLYRQQMLGDGAFEAGALLPMVPADGSFAADVLPAALLAAGGMSLACIPVMMAALSGAAPQTPGSRRPQRERAPP